MKLQLAAPVLISLAALSLLTFSLGAGAPAAPAYPIAVPSPESAFIVTPLANAAKRFRVTGKVEAVNYADNSVEIKAAGQLVEIQITPTTVIEIHGEGGSIADVRRGQKVTASGVMRDGAWVAHSIAIK